jgi:hypothetical protein
MTCDHQLKKEVRRPNLPASWRIPTNHERVFGVAFPSPPPPLEEDVFSGRWQVFLRRSAVFQTAVSQISNLLRVGMLRYHRWFQRLAECNSAIQQITKLRYEPPALRLDYECRRDTLNTFLEEERETNTRFTHSPFTHSPFNYLTI